MILALLISFQTPPERMLADYLRAFNVRDGAGLSEFLRTRFEWPKDRPELREGFTADQMRLRKASGGLDLGGVRQLRAGSLVADVRNRRLGTWSRLSLFLAAAPPNFKTPTLPYRIVGIGMADEPMPESRLPRERLSDADIGMRLGRLMQEYVTSTDFAGVVLVARRGRPLFAHAYGLANRSYDVPNTMATRFNLASITKMFTAVAVTQLADAGKLSFDDRVGKLLPGYPNADVAQNVTVHELLSHTSGMIGGGELVAKHPTAPKARTVDDHMKPFLGEPLAFRPGVRFGYSNAGYILLGRIVERISGQSFYDYVRDHVFGPAGMHASGFPELDLPNHNLSTGYDGAPGGRRRDNIFDLTVRGSPATGAYATASDMDRFARALMEGRLVQPKTRERMWTGVTRDDEAGTAYGYGATIERYAGHKVVSHGGGMVGITNHFEFYPDLGVSVTILGNTDAEPNPIAYKVREWILQGHWAQKPSKPLDSPDRESPS